MIDTITYQHQFDNQVVLIRNIETIVFCNIITSNESKKFVNVHLWHSIIEVSM